jgi:hypothetical protein
VKGAGGTPAAVRAALLGLGENWLVQSSTGLKEEYQGLAAVPAVLCT